MFNALSMLRDEHEIDPASEVVHDIGEQFDAARQVGDVLILDPSFQRERGWLPEERNLAQAEADPKFSKSDELESTERPAEFESHAADTAESATGEIPKFRRELQQQVNRRRFLAAIGFAWQTTLLAVRNLVRHTRRTALSLGTIGFGVAALLLAGGFAEWMIWMGREATIHSRLGHVQIVRKDYFERGIADPHSYLLTLDESALAKLSRIPHVEAVTPRLNYAGLISRGDTTLSFLGEGVVPSTEAAISKEVVIVEGDNLSDQAATGIILGKGLANSLNAKPGDEVVLLVTAASGSPSGVDAVVRGIFQTITKAYDDVALRAPLALSQTLTRSAGAHQYIVVLDDTEATNEVYEQVANLLADEQPPLQAIRWIELADFYRAVEKLFSSQIQFVRAIIALIIVLTISNTFTMVVMERTSEIGTLMALGFRRTRILNLFVVEGVVTGLVGASLGTVVGVGLAHVISYFGIPMPPAPGMDHGYLAEVRLTWRLVAIGVMVALASSTLASIYPAFKASRLNVVDALRHSR